VIDVIIGGADPVLTSSINQEKSKMLYHSFMEEQRIIERTYESLSIDQLQFR
jgi:hypothetical protein